MSGSPPMQLNLIGKETVCKYDPPYCWSPKCRQELAKEIASRIDPLKKNIRIVQPKDNLGRIAEGLSCGRIKLKEEGGEGWETVTVDYIGTSARILEQKSSNPKATLIGASLIYPQQFVYLKNDKVIVVADSIESLE